MKEQEIDLENEWGPAASYSEYAVGARVEYMQGRERYTGRIVFACASTGPSLPLRYVVARDGAPGDSWPDVIWQIDILEIIG